MIGCSGDYEKNGLLYCGRCATPKQCRVNICGTVRIVGCLCECENKQHEAEKKRMHHEEERLKVDSLRLTGIADKGLRSCRFENAFNSGLISRCRNYVDQWEAAKSENIGMLLWGDTGGGKTYAAACVANALIEKGNAVMITSFPRILTAGFGEREELLQKIGKFSLLVLDDLGTERETGAALEAVYCVVDERYKSRKPLIVTTNMHLKDIKEPADMAHKRIFSRILEMCTPILVEKQEYRMKKTSHKMQIAKLIFDGH